MQTAYGPAPGAYFDAFLSLGQGGMDGKVSSWIGVIRKNDLLTVDLFSFLYEILSNSDYRFDEHKLAMMTDRGG